MVTRASAVAMHLAAALPFLAYPLLATLAYYALRPGISIWRFLYNLFLHGIRFELVQRFVMFACIALAFVGGLEHAVARNSAPPSKLLSALGICTALSAWAVLPTSQYLASPAVASGLSVVYSASMVLEALVVQPRPAIAAAVLSKERRLTMLSASLALAVCSIEAGGHILGCVALSLLATIAFALPGALAAPPSAGLYSRVGVGTLNPCKLGAVRHALALYPEVGGLSAQVVPCAVGSGVSEQPMGLDETSRGAKQRASAAHAAAAAEGGGGLVLGVGIESGLFELDGAYFDVCVVSAYDGSAHHLGLSCAFEVPPAVARALFSKAGMDLSKASNDAGVSSDPKLGEHGGLIGCLSGMAITREEYTVQAVRTALFFAADANKAFY